MQSQDYEFGGHTGNLEIDSPSAIYLIGSILGADAMRTISLVYEHACGSGALKEDNIRRTPAVRFNPRPARIIQILLSEAGCRDPLIIESAVKESANKNIFDLAHLLNKSSDIICREPYLAAGLLDTLRHLHMSPDFQSAEHQDTIYKLTKKFELDPLDCLPRLQILISSALARIQKKMKGLPHDIKKCY